MKNKVSRSLVRSKEQTHPNIPSSLFPPLLCRRTPALSLLAHAVSYDKVERPDHKPTLAAEQSVNFRRKRLISDLRIGRSVVLDTEGSEEVKEVRKTRGVTPRGRDQKQSGRGYPPRPSSKQRLFRARRVQCRPPSRFSAIQAISSNQSQDTQPNSHFSLNLLRNATPTEVLYVNKNPQLKNGIAILNLDNFGTKGFFCRNPSHQIFGQDFKEILQGMSEEFSIVLRSQQMATRVPSLLQQLKEWNIEILAWINVAKVHSPSNKLYNLSEVLNIIGTLTNIWVFEGQTDAAPRDITEEIMLPVFEQSVNLNLVLFKTSEKQSLAQAKTSSMRSLPSLDCGSLVSLSNIHQASSLRTLSEQTQPIDTRQSLEYDVGSFKDKLVTYMKILKAERKASISTSVNYLVGDLIKRNFRIFETVLGVEPTRIIDLNNPTSSTSPSHQQTTYAIEILSFCPT